MSSVSLVCGCECHKSGEFKDMMNCKECLCHEKALDMIVDQQSNLDRKQDEEDYEYGYQYGDEEQ